jgi:hypothetical protein
MEFLQANWLWIVLGIGAVWLLFGRGGMGCGMGGHGSHGSHGSSDARQAPSTPGAHDGHGRDEAPARKTETASPRAHRGC